MLVVLWLCLLPKLPGHVWHFALYLCSCMCYVRMLEVTRHTEECVDV